MYFTIWPCAYTWSRSCNTCFVTRWPTGTSQIFPPELNRFGFEFPNFNRVLTGPPDQVLPYYRDNSFRIPSRSTSPTHRWVPFLDLISLKKRLDAV